MERRCYGTKTPYKTSNIIEYSLASILESRILLKYFLIFIIVLIVFHGSYIKGDMSSDKVDQIKPDNHMLENIIDSIGEEQFSIELLVFLCLLFFSEIVNLDEEIDKNKQDYESNYISNPPSLEENTIINIDSEKNQAPICVSDIQCKDTHDKDNILPNNLPSVIRNQYRGVCVTAMLPNGILVTGEVTFNFNNIIALKYDNTIVFINEKNIISFY